MESKCICDACPRRFVCFTQKKVFSDPAYQAMYEALIEEEVESKKAATTVRKFIEQHVCIGIQKKAAFLIRFAKLIY